MDNGDATAVERSKWVRVVLESSVEADVSPASDAIGND